MSAVATLVEPSFWERLRARPLPDAPPPAVVTPTRVRGPRTAYIDPLHIEYVTTRPVVRPQPGLGCDYGVIQSIAELREYLRPCFEDRLWFGSDYETTSLNTARAQIVGQGVSVGPKSGRYIPVGHTAPSDAGYENLPPREVLKVFQELDALGVTSLWYNVGYDLEVSYRRYGWEPQHWHDVQVAIYLVNSNAIELNLNTTALRFLGTRMQTIEELDEEWVVLSQKAKRERPPKMPHQLPIEKVAPYGCADPDCTRQLWYHPSTQQAIDEQQVIFALEERLIPVMREGIRHGVYIDAARLKALQGETLARLAELRPTIQAQLPGEPFNLSQRTRLGEALFAMRAIGYVDNNPNSPTVGQWTVERTNTGKITTNKKILDKYRRQHPIIPALIEYAELEAQERNYLRKLIAAVEHFAQEPWAEGRCRFAFNSIGVPTGRMKCGGAGKGKQAYLKGAVDVNGQSLPDHEKAPYLPNTRSAIVAPPGYVVLAADYSQIELRVAANLSREPAWIEAYRNDADLHLVNAQIITNVREPGVIVTKSDKQRRGHAKTTSFALLYGGDENTVARNAGIPVDEAEQILDAFYAGLPRLKAWIDGMHASARSRGTVKTFAGRIRHLEQYFQPEPTRANFKVWRAWKKLDARGCREAINDPIQGGAADLFKVACIRLREAIQRHGWGTDILSPQVFWVHDEVMFYVRQEWVTRVVPVLQAAMEFPVADWPVPIKAEFEVGSSQLYAMAKVAMARADGKDPEPKWLAQADAPDVSNYGELVPLEDWVAHYAPHPVAMVS